MIFMTKLPIPFLPKATEEDWGRISPYFVFIGYLIGVFLFLLSWLVYSLQLPHLFAAALIVLVWYLITGCLHLDGFLDTFDGIGCQQPERKLIAMRDSRVGAIGSIAGTFMILFKVLSVGVLFEKDLLFLLLLSPPVARLVSVYAMVFLKKNDDKSRSSSLIAAGIKSPGDFIINLIVLFLGVGVMILISPTSFVFFLTFPIICFLLNITWAHKLGKMFAGHVGDTYGALIEMSETTTIIFAILVSAVLG